MKSKAQRLVPLDFDVIDRIPVPTLSVIVKTPTKSVKGGGYRLCVTRRSRVEAEALPKAKPPVKAICGCSPAFSEVRLCLSVGAFQHQSFVYGNTRWINVSAEWVESAKRIVESLAQNGYG
jgi:hypothetical protein